MVRFIEEGHRYVDDLGREFLSVTKLLGEFYPFDKDKIIQEVIKIPNSIYYGMTPEEVSLRWDGASEIGTEFHKAVQDYFEKGAISDKFRVPVSKIASGKWGKMECEKITWITALRLAGTVDMSEYKGSYIRIWDLKTCRKLAKDKIKKFSVQLEIYRRAKEEREGVPVRIGGIIWLPNLQENNSALPQIVPAVDCSKDVATILQARREQLWQTSTK